LRGQRRDVLHGALDHSVSHAAHRIGAEFHRGGVVRHLGE
jgi:hypothetical protein